MCECWNICVTINIDILVKIKSISTVYSRFHSLKANELKTTETKIKMFKLKNLAFDMCETSNITCFLKCLHFAINFALDFYKLLEKIFYYKFL